MEAKHIDLSGTVAVVTGASRGIGEATARHLAACGAKVGLLARSADAVEAIAAEIGEDHAIGLPANVAHYEALSQAFARVEERFGPVNLLVNNAGVIEPIARIEESDPAAWAQVVAINLTGAYNTIRLVLPGMIACGRGQIINISSGAATGALEGWSHYCATKAGLLSLTRCVHRESAGHGVRCVGLSPGTVATTMQRDIKRSGVNPVSQLAWEAHIPAEWVAQAIAWLTTDAAREHDGGDFSLKTDEGRAAVGLPALG
ncbi:MAG: SDR family oxidoreductase [Pseudomonadota bacterium]